MLWYWKVSEKTPRGVILPVCVKYRITPQERKKLLKDNFKVKRSVFFAAWVCTVQSPVKALETARAEMG
jgi:hypothetical protein